LEAALRTWQELTDEIGVAEVLTFMGSMEQMKGHFAAATRLYEQSLESWRRAGGLHGVATSLDALLHNMGELAYEQGDLDAAASLFEQSIAASRQLGVTMPLIHPLTGLGQIARDRGDRAAATALFEDSLEIARRFGYRRGEAGSLQFLAQLALTDGDHRAAERRYSEALKVWSVVNDRLGIAWGLEGLAGAEVGLGDAERAATLLGAAEQLREVINTPPAPSELTDLGHTLQAARAAMEEGAFSVAWERGRSTPHEVVVAWALASDGRAAPADEGAPETAPPEPRSLSARQP
jgi:tetratricopeptide (TPR) repeat protein